MFFAFTGASGDGYSMGLENQMPVGKIGAKKQRRLEMKEEKKFLREVWNYSQLLDIVQPSLWNDWAAKWLAFSC